MKIFTCPDDTSELDKFCAKSADLKWQLVISGIWEQGPYHSGYIQYYVAQLDSMTWLLESVERNAILDDVTDEDVEEGALNDDQIQAMWGMTLQEAQDQEYRCIVAVCNDVPKSIAIKEVAQALYEAVCRAGGKRISEPDEGDGLLD